MYDKISLSKQLHNQELDIIGEGMLIEILEDIKKDQKETCDLIEISGDHINFYKTNYPVDHTHIFHLKTISPEIIKEIKFADNIHIRYIPFLNLSRLEDDPQEIPSFELINLITLLIDKGYSKIKKDADNSFSMKKRLG